MASDRLPIKFVGKIVKGFGRGSKQLGIPTANIQPEVVQKLDLTNGVFYGLAQILLPKSDTSNDTSQVTNNLPEIFHQTSDQIVSSVCMMCCSFGYNPYYQNQEKTLEVHVMEKIGIDLYGATMKGIICGKIREEQNFSDLSSLITAINNDIKFAKKELELPTWSHLLKDSEFFII